MHSCINLSEVCASNLKYAHNALCSCIVHKLFTMIYVTYFSGLWAVWWNMWPWTIANNKKMEKGMSSIINICSDCWLWFHYNTILYNTISIETRLPLGSQIFVQYNMWQNVSKRSRYKQCKLWNSYSCVFSSQVWHQFIFPGAVSTGHSIYNAYVIGNHV